MDQTDPPGESPGIAPQFRDPALGPPPLQETSVELHGWTSHSPAAPPAVKSTPWPWQVRWIISWLPAVTFPFFVMFGSFVVSIVVMLVGLVMFAGPESLGDQAAFMETMQRWMEQPWGFFWTAAPPQLVMLLSAGLVALLSREKWRQRLGLRRGAYSPWLWPVLMLSAPAVALGVDYLAQGIQLEPSQHLVDLEQTILAQAHRNLGLVVLLIAVLPGIAEEFVFRGYVQDRLVKVWHPSLAILFSSFTFALAHLDPMHVALVLPLGLWLGILSWRANSIWPAIGGHFANNLFSVVLTLPSVAAWMTGPSEWILMGILTLLFLASVVIVCVVPRRIEPSPEWLTDVSSGH